MNPRLQTQGPNGVARRIGAILLRHLYLMRSSWTRVFDLMYWPLLQMVVWGFITVFLGRSSWWVAQAGGILIGAVLLWDVLVRGQFGMTLSLLEEMWSRNLASLFVTPLRPYEYAVSLMMLSVLRTIIGVGPAALLAIPLFAWSVGLFIAAMLLRVGLAAESFAWASIFALAPISGVYYPLDTLPAWLQPAALALPPTYVFEGMRAIVLEGTVRFDMMAKALALDLIYLGISVTVFLVAFRGARIRGRLMASGE
jgi:ABC-2 type transport system permease protein